MLRTIAAVIIGYMTFAFSAVLLFHLTEHDPHKSQDAGFVIFSIVYGAIFAIVSGYITALIAESKHVRHAQVLGILIALAALISLIARPGEGAVWSQIATLFIIAPCAILGGILRYMNLRRRSA